MKIAEIGDELQYSFGGKAHGLSLLKSKGFLVPDAICIEYTEDRNEFDSNRFKEALYNRIQNMECATDDAGKWYLAVRSSSLIEDTAEESMAGHFLSKIGWFSFEDLITSVKDVYNSGDKMAVVVQAAVDAEVSGVFFSSDPNTYSKRKGIISYTTGMGESLVSGQGEYHDVSIDFDKDSETAEYERFHKLIADVKELEGHLGYPIDIEWCIKDGSIFYIQCRPIASITSVKSGYYGINDVLPVQIKSHDKIRLRIEAEKTDTYISNAYVHVKNLSKIPVASESSHQAKIIPGVYCKGYSVVIIYPRRVSDKIIRSFVGENSVVSKSIGRCYRYGVRAYPEYKDLINCMDDFHRKTEDDYWLSAVIVQEIFDPVYTGIFQKTDDGCILEVTKGHFLTKGNVVTSQYYVKNGLIAERNEVHQNIWYRIVQGHVIECFCNDENNTLVHLSDDQIDDIIGAFEEIGKYGNRVIEFGMVRDGNDLLPYLIDFVDSDDKVKEISISEGIVSPGKRKGVIKHIDMETDALNSHFYDERATQNLLSQDVVFVCDTPNIDLLKLLDEYDNSRISFAFKDGSVLCHLSVVLRERGIPAVKTGNLQLKEGATCIVDAQTSGLKGSERIIYV